MKRQDRDPWRTHDQDRLEATVGELLLFAEADLPVEGRAQKTASAMIQRLDRLAWSTNIARVTPPDRETVRPVVTPELIQEVHADLRRGLVRLFPLAGRPEQWDLPAVPAQRALRVSGGRVVAFFTGEWPGTVWLTVAGLLERFGDRIRRCLDPTCGRLFLRVRKQEYCCLNHARRAYMRKYRKESR